MSNGIRAICLISFLLILGFSIFMSFQEPSLGHSPGGIHKQTAPVKKAVFRNSDDGTEMNDAQWYEDGFVSSHNILGRNFSNYHCDSGFRFCLDGYEQGDTVIFARLRFASFGSDITSSVKLLINGVLLENPTTFSQWDRPSQKLPKTNSAVLWEIDENWDEGGVCVPNYYSSPDLSSIVNEILALPNWGVGQEGKRLIVTIDDQSVASELNYVRFDDVESPYPVTTPVLLELYETVIDTLAGKELLGRVTDTTVTVNIYSLIETDFFVEYGTTPGIYTDQTAVVAGHPAETAGEIVLDNLLPDTRYYYRLAVRRSGLGSYETGEERTFHTKRSQSSTFSFSVIADEHAQLAHNLPQNDRMIRLFETTIQNIAASGPDFLISLGDLACPFTGRWRSASNLAEAKERYLLARRYVGEVTHSASFYLVLGNHEAERGWCYIDPDDELTIISVLARKELIPNPVPDAFYSGNVEMVPEYGLREDYYSWEWGDALFVVLDPFWYTMNKPHNHGGSTGTHNGWDWTYGKEQYDWLFETLNSSDAKWKFVFTHHLTSTTITGWPPDWYTPYYGRGGIEIAKHKVDQRPSFEWGGEDETGADVFDQERPGWSHGPIHDMMVAAGVTIVFHGHDHFFGKQDLDGIVYLECPTPNDANYGRGFMIAGEYVNGDMYRNAGHVQITVNGPGSVTLEYIRAYLPGDGTNGEVACSYTIF